MAKELTHKKKKWYLVLAPKLFNNALIGETFVADPSLVVGRKLTTNLSNLTGNIKHQSLNLKFEVSGLKDDAAETQLIGFEKTPAAIKRLVRRNANRIDSSFTAETSDKKKVRVKPLLLTRYKAQGRVIKNLRVELDKSLMGEINKLTYDNLVKAMVSYSLQRDVKTKLKKIYPVRTLEIKKLELEQEEIEKAGVKKGAKQEAKKGLKKKAKKETKEEPEEGVKKGAKEETKQKTREKKQAKQRTDSKEKTQEKE